MAITGISHATVYVNDQEKALDFYTNVLGFEKRQDAPMGEGLRWLEVAPPGSPVIVNLIHGYGGWEPDRVGKSTGIILTANDVRATVEDLRAKGVAVTMEPQSLDWGTNAMIADPDGNSFVIGGP